MSRRKGNTIFSEMAGVPVQRLLANPLIAVARAQNMMARTEVQTLLQSCFIYEDGVYYPIMLELALERVFVEPGDRLHEVATIKEVTTVFSVPMITIFPISSLGVDFIDISFNFEVTAQYQVNAEFEEAEGQRNGRDASPLNPVPEVELVGNILAAQPVTGSGSGSTSYEWSKSANYQVDVHAEALPLPRGLTILLELYSNSIQPKEISTGDECK